MSGGVQARVIGPRVLVKPLAANEQTDSGILLPDEVRSKESRGMVLAVGSWLSPDGMIDEGRPLPVEPGDTVVYASRSGTPIRLDLAEDGHAEDLLVLGIQEVLLVLQDVRVTAW